MIKQQADEESSWVAFDDESLWVEERDVGHLPYDDDPADNRQAAMLWAIAIGAAFIMIVAWLGGW